MARVPWFAKCRRPAPCVRPGCADCAALPKDKIELTAKPEKMRIT